MSRRRSADRRDAFDAPRMGMLIAGLEVPHVHLHVFPALSMETFDLSKAAKDVTQETLEEHAVKIRQSLVDHGYRENVPD